MIANLVLALAVVAVCVGFILSLAWWLIRESASHTIRWAERQRQQERDARHR